MIGADTGDASPLQQPRPKKKKKKKFVTNNEEEKLEQELQTLRNEDDLGLTMIGDSKPL